VRNNGKRSSALDLVIVLHLLVTSGNNPNHRLLRRTLYRLVILPGI
jgi:hypothetical protein